MQLLEKCVITEVMIRVIYINYRRACTAEMLNEVRKRVKLHGLIYKCLSWVSLVSQINLCPRFIQHGRNSFLKRQFHTEWSWTSICYRSKLKIGHSEKKKNADNTRAEFLSLCLLSEQTGSYVLKAPRSDLIHSCVCVCVCVI